MRVTFLFALLCSCFNFCNGQTRPSSAEIAQKIKAAQEKIEAAKKANPNFAKVGDYNVLVNKKLDSIRKLHPEQHISAVNINTNIPDLNARTTQALAQNKQANQRVQAARKDYTQSLPVKKAGVTITNITAPTQAYITKLAKDLLASAQLVPINIVEKTRLDRMLADTSINVPGTAMLMLANGVPKFEGEYLICKEIIAHPFYAWAINDLAILYRNDRKYPESIAAFQYALGLLHDSSLVIKTNLAWACSYFGDFTAAKKYFNEVLKTDQAFSSAMEGLAIIAYNEGDLGALFDCLMKELTGLGGGDGGGSGPSPEFTGLCGGVMDQNATAAAAAGGDADPTMDHTFDHVADDSPDQDPATAEDDRVKYPDMKFIFVNDAMDLSRFFAGQFGQAQNKIKEELQKCIAVPNQKMITLPPLTPPPYLDEHGDKIIPANYEKYVTLFHRESDLFMRKVYWSAKKYDEELAAFLKPLQLNKADMIMQYAKAMAACDDDKCRNAVACVWVPRVHSSKNTDLEAAGRIWNKYFEQVLAECNSYIQNSSPFIKRVHTQQWNEYMNLQRQYNARKAYLVMYNKWLDALVGVGDNPIMHLPFDVCNIELRLISDASPDPYSKKLKPLKTFAGPCYTEKVDVPLGPISIHDGCDKTKISLAAGPFGFSAEKDYSKKFKEDDYFQLGVNVGVGRKIGYEQHADQSSASVEAGVSANVEAFWRFNSNLDLTAKGFDANFEATVKGEVKTGNNIIDEHFNTINTSAGISGGFEVMTLCGEDVPANYKITNVHIEKK